MLVSVLIITGLRMAALRNAVSPDFTYSQSYLSLLSSAGCMTGVICCASPAIRAKVHRARQDKAIRWRPNPDLELYISGPTVMDTRGTRTAPGLEEGRNNNDLEKGLNSGTDTDVDDGRSAREAISNTEKAIAPLREDVNKAAIAMVNSGRIRENELLLDQGQLFWIHQKHEQGWLLAQNPRTNEIGLVPERFVQLIGSMPWCLDKQVEISKSLQSFLKHCADSEPK